jgi:serine phosphatase RsbU (regulator of sigma subunit)
MRLVVLQAGAMISDMTCGREAVYIGSRDGCAVQLSDPRIAEQQAVIYPEGNGAWVVEQLDTHNDLRLNGANVTAKTPLKSGDEIQVGDFAIRAYPEHEEQTGPRVEVATSVGRLVKFAQATLPAGTVIKKLDETVTIQAAQMLKLGQLNTRLGSCTLVEELIDAVVQTLLEAFAAQRVWIGVRRVNYGPMEYVAGKLLTGQQAELPEQGDNYKPRVLDRAQFLLVPRISREERISVMAGPLAVPGNTLGMIYVDSGESGRRFETEDFDFFVMTANVIAVQLDNIFKRIAKNREAMIDGEVSVSHEIQARVTPRKLPQWEQLQFGAFREPGRQHTGDVYDVVRLKNNQAGILVAHTTAAGPMPSLLMAQAQAVFRSAVAHVDSPDVFMRTLNWLLYDGQKDHPLDAFMAYIDPGTGDMRYSMAAKTGAYIISARGDERSLLPTEPTPSLGLNKAAVYPLMPEHLDSGETIAIFTPGVTTAKNSNKETFGEERFVNILADGFGQLASAMLKEMFNDVRNFTEGGAQPDDITVVLAHRV